MGLRALQSDQQSNGKSLQVSLEYIYIRITENASSTLADGEFFNRAFAVWNLFQRYPLWFIMGF